MPALPPSAAGADHSPRPVHSPPPAPEPTIHLGRVMPRGRRPAGQTTLPSPVLIASQTLTLPLDQTPLVGELDLPTQATGLVVVGHCGGSSRLSSRSRHLSRLLQQADLGVFSVDLLLPAEARGHPGPAHLPQLAQRLVALCRWLRRQPELAGLRLGLLGEGNASAVALEAAEQLGELVGAVVSFGGSSLALSPSRPRQSAPTLLLVGEHDAAATELTRQPPAAQATAAPCTVHVVAQAGPVFQEPGTLAQASTQAAGWFTCYLARHVHPRT